MYSFQLELIHQLQLLRTPFLDGFFKFLNFFDTSYFTFILIPAIWLGYNYKSGVRLFYAILFSNFLNIILKHLFMHPRPYHLDPTLLIIKVGGYSFPSGGSQTAILLSLIMITKWKNTALKWILGINFFFWISLSRVYLGVHFITDVLAGWTVGFFVFLMYYYLFPKIEIFLKQKSNMKVLLISQIFSLSLMLGQYTQILNLSFLSLAIGLGLFLFDKHKSNYKFSNISINIFRSFFGISGVFLIYFISIYFLSFFSSFGFKIGMLIQCYLSGLWLSIGAFYFFNLIFKRILKN